MTILEKALLQSKEDKTIIGLRMYGDDTKFWCGYIVDFSSDFLIIQHFSKHGLADGFVLEKMENLESVDIEDKYSQTFQRLISKTKNNYNDSSLVKMPTSDNWQHEFLSNCQSKELTVAVDFEDDFSIVGRIAEVDTDYVNIETIGKLGELDGFSIYRISDIESIRVNSLELIKITGFLNENKTVANKK